MLKIGLTGGIGSGKSAVRDLLAGKGAVIFDADAVARRLMESDPDVREALRKVLGSHAWQEDGSLNKPWIAKRIFSDDDLRSSVNDIVHPAVHAAFKQDADAAERSGASAIVREAALLPTPERRRALDRLVAVVAPRSVRLQRVLLRDGLTVSEIEDRMKAQPDDELYAAFADDVIRNEGTLDDLAASVDELWTAWMTSSSLSDNQPTDPHE
jgi:dephospho-CoA kinase